MHLFWLFQFLVRETYSYPSLLPLLQESILEIEDSDLPSREKQFALFFSAASQMELGETDGMDFIVDQYGDELALEISLAIGHETKRAKSASRLMKKQDKRIKKLLKGSRALSASVKRLYDKPISELPDANR